jgi:hypothetical protein
VELENVEGELKSERVKEFRSAKIRGLETARDGKR